MSKGLPRVEWPTLGLIALMYTGWLVAGIIIWPNAPWLGVGVLALLIALHSSLVHEVCHGHPTRIGWLNEALVTVNPGLIWPFRRFRQLHLRHHANEMLTDPFEDPESYYRAEVVMGQMPRWLLPILAFNNTMLGRLIVGPWLGAIGLVLGDLRLIHGGDRTVLRAWIIHLISVVPVMLAIWFVFAMSVWHYLLAVWIGTAIISVRTYAEHRWHEDPEGRSIIVERTPLSWLFLNNNLHVVHHDQPQLPWYALPDAYRRASEDWRRRNDGYVYRNYWALFRQYALRAKEPVVHPRWYRGEGSK